MAEPSQDANKASEAETASDASATLSAKEQWLEENRSAILAWNDWVEQKGMPYDEYRHVDLASY